jgi:hypothetical protein
MLAKKQRCGSTGSRRQTLCAAASKSKGLMTLEELQERLTEIDEILETARAELATLEGSRQRLEELKHDQQTLMGRYAGAVPNALDNLIPEERHRIYKIHRLKVLVYPDVRLQVSGVLRTNQEVCLFEPLSRRRRTPSPRRPGGS